MGETLIKALPAGVTEPSFQNITLHGQLSDLLEEVRLSAASLSAFSVVEGL